MSTQVPPLTIVQPGEGGSGNLGTIGVAFKLWGKNTNGEVSIVEHPFPVGALVPPHLHTRGRVFDSYAGRNWIPIWRSGGGFGFWWLHHQTAR
jgi:hypothetical protein